MIKNYNPGSDITILDTIYQYPKRNEEGDGYEDDFISILYRDNKTGAKDHYVIYNPDYEYYELAPGEEVQQFNKFFVEKEKVVPRRVPFKDLLRDIAERSGNLDMFYDNIRNGNSRGNKILHTLYHIFNSDMDINDHYRFRFDKMYTNEVVPISKAYFDIEVDTINMLGDFPEMGECPINAVSYIFSNKVTVFLLRNKDNPLIEEFEKSINRDLFNELNDFIISNVGGIDKARKFHVDNLEYEFKFYDDEVCLIHELFEYVNMNEPDFLLAWNMAFDIPYIIERLYALGYDPKEFLCHPSFSMDQRVCKYYIDEQHKNEYAERGDRYTISSHTIYLDQLIHFASRRKGQSKFPNFKLDTAGSIIAGVRKLDYSHITTNISKLPYLDYKTFVFYNIMDTIVQKCIEEETKDIDYVFSKCLINNTRYDKCHRQTVYLANRATKEFYRQGYIIGNNVNSFGGVEVIPFEGARVSDPLNNSDYSKVRIHGRPVNIMDNLDDFDFKSLYPSVDREFNIAPNTQIGKVIIPDQVFNGENPLKSDMYDRGAKYIEDLTSGDTISFCHRWLKYPSFSELLDDIDEFLIEENRTKEYDYLYDNNKLMVKVSNGDGNPLMIKVGEHEYPRMKLMERVHKPLDYDKYRR